VDGGGRDGNSGIGVCKGKVAKGEGRYGGAGEEGLLKEGEPGAKTLLYIPEHRRGRTEIDSAVRESTYIILSLEDKATGTQRKKGRRIKKRGRRKEWVAVK